MAQRCDDRAQISPPLLWLAPQSDHGSAARAETEAFSQSGPPQSFFELSWLALQKARQGASFLSASSYGSLRSPITGVPRARRPTKSTPPLLALAPQSDHGSAARAETEAFFQYGLPQSFFELTWLALQKARGREVAQRLMTRRKFLSPSLLWLAPQSDHGSAARAETEAFFQYGPPQSFAGPGSPTKSTCAGSWRNDDDRAQISKPPPLGARSAIRSRERRARGN